MMKKIIRKLREHYDRHEETYLVAAGIMGTLGMLILLQQHAIKGLNRFLDEKGLIGEYYFEPALGQEEKPQKDRFRDLSREELALARNRLGAGYTIPEVASSLGISEISLASQVHNEGAGQHLYTVAVIGCTKIQADQVMVNRLEPEEDYGFPYSLHYSSN